MASLPVSTNSGVPSDVQLGLFPLRLSKFTKRYNAEPCWWVHSLPGCPFDYNDVIHTWTIWLYYVMWCHFITLDYDGLIQCQVLVVPFTLWPSIWLLSSELSQAFTGGLGNQTRHSQTKRDTQTGGGNTMKQHTRTDRIYRVFQKEWQK